MKPRSAHILKIVCSVFIAFVFIQSLFFKFTNSPETQHIFTTLDKWAARFGFEGLFVAPGIFNAYVIGSAELLAPIVLLVGLFTGKKVLTAVGALLAFGIISGAVFFHLFTPLGIEVQGDGGTLFAMAVLVLISSLTLLVMHKDVLFAIVRRENK